MVCQYLTLGRLLREHRLASIHPVEVSGTLVDALSPMLILIGPSCSELRQQAAWAFFVKLIAATQVLVGDYGYC
jgi:hypothetical protein